MSDQEIFEFLFTYAASENFQRGAVAACIVRHGEILISSNRSDALYRHAEDLLLEKVAKKGIMLEHDDILYVTVQPCGERTPGGPGEKFGSCTDLILRSDIKNVVYAVPDHHNSLETDKKFAHAGISSRKVADDHITERAREVYNASLVDKDYIKKKDKKAFL